MKRMFGYGESLRRTIECVAEWGFEQLRLRIVRIPPDRHAKVVKRARVRLSTPFDRAIHLRVECVARPLPATMLRLQ